MLNVKNTILKYLADIGSPHYCCSCGKLGKILCESCKYDITSAPFLHCIVCGKPNVRQSLCSLHRLAYSHAYTVGWRQGSLEKLIAASKHESQREGCMTQAALLATVLPELDETAIIVPIPTIRAHIRQRGYDHMLLVAREVARLRGVTCLPVLQRVTNTTNTGASRSERHAHAATAFRVSADIDPTATYLLIDDVYTTGATLTEAAKLLRASGAKNLWIAATTRQPNRQRHDIIVGSVKNRKYHDEFDTSWSSKTEK